MTLASSPLLSFEAFLTRYRNNPRYELADGELVDLEPTGPHVRAAAPLELMVAGKIASKLSVEIERQEHPWFIPRTCLLQPFTDVITARRPDVVVLDELCFGK